MQSCPFFFLIIILESNTASLKWAINNSKANVGVVANHVKSRPGSYQPWPNFHTCIQQFKSGEKVNAQIIIQHETIGSTKHFYSPCEKGLRHGCVHNFIKAFLKVIPFTIPNPFVFSDGSLEVVWNVRFVHKQSIRVVNLLIVDVHLNIGKNCMQNVVYMSNERNWSILHLLLCLRFPRFSGFFFVLFFYFFGFVSFVTTNLDTFQFQRQVRLSQMNAVVPIRLKVKLCSFHRVR